ncbi:MAG: response regulator [Opitutaceae bacterium]|jgi:hypothetical protein|nr:response regulator [Opitutaceae bacterium]
MKPCLLLVDDHDANLATLEAILGETDYELHTAKDGHRACELAVILRPDLVLLDVMMPGMDGYEVCRHFRATPALASMPVVMLTALNDKASRLEGIRCGADDFISKPFSHEELRARVRTITRLNRYRIIAEQRARFEHLFGLSPAAIMTVRADGLLVEVNARAEALFLSSGAQPRAERVLSDVLPAEATALIARMVEKTLVGEAVPEPAVITLGREETERVMNVRAACLRERDGDLAVIQLDDITAEVKARRVVENMNRELETRVQARTRELEAANQLLLSYAAFVSHDLRSPLSAVKGYLSFLDTGPLPMSSEVKTCVGGALGAANMMEEMITNILQLAKEEHAASTVDEPLDPRPVIDKLCWKLAALCPKPRPEIVVHALPPVPASPALVERVFYNLVANALKFSADRAQPRVEIGALESAEGPVIYVKDNGVGFDEPEAAKLFQEFSRLSSADGTEGVGLGLSLVSRLMRAHHGRIWAESRPGEGATFFVHFCNTPSTS